MKMFSILFIMMLFAIIEANSQQCTKCSGSTDNSGTYASAIGDSTIATGNAAFASGYATWATANFSSVSGYRSRATGLYSYAHGFYAYAEASKSICLGSMVKVNSFAERAIVIGSGGEYQSDQFLSNGIPRTLMIGFSSIYPTLFVSESTPSVYNDKTGKVGIGNVTNPSAKLHLKADNDESANFFLEPSNWTVDYNAEIFMGNQQHGISAELNKGLVFKTQKFYLFDQGNLGIGTEEPAAKVHIKSGDIYIEDIDRGIIMKSPNGTCWRGSLNDQGQLIFQELSECPEDAAISIKESTPNKLDISIHPNPAKNIIEIEIPDLGSKSLAFKLVDENGKVVKSLNITGIKTTVNIADLVPGLYFGNFSGEQVYFVEKIIKL